MHVTTKKQPTLKPQDIVVALKIAINKEQTRTYAELGSELSISPSEVHAAVLRAEMSRLIARGDGKLIGLRSSIAEFLVHGVKYAFPALIGSISRGMATSVGAAPLKDIFVSSSDLVHVWPDSEGQDRGPSLRPLYPSLPFAARSDRRLYEILVLVDALRIGGAREREVATMEIMRRL